MTDEQKTEAIDFTLKTLSEILASDDKRKATMEQIDSLLDKRNAITQRK